MEERTDLYEVTLILKEATTADIEKNIKEYAEIKKSTDVGVRQFAYSIGKLTSGHYYALEFVSNHDNLSKIEQELKTDKNIIRFLLTKAIRKGPEPIRTGKWAKKEEKPVKHVSAKIPQVKEEPIAEVPSPVETTAPEKVAQMEKAKIEVFKPEIVEPVIEEPVVEKPAIKKVREVKNVKIAEPTKSSERKPATNDQKLVTRKPRAKAEKVSAAELDKKLEELVKE